MSDLRPATSFLVQAAQRLADREGVPLTVLKKGDPTSGTIVLKIALLNGSARVLVEARRDFERVWTPATRTDPMSERDADAYVARQKDSDPDAWLIEIEDKQGRIWFEGKVAE